MVRRACRLCRAISATSRTGAGVCCAIAPWPGIGISNDRMNRPAVQTGVGASRIAVPASPVGLRLAAIWPSRPVSSLCEVALLAAAYLAELGFH